MKSPLWAASKTERLLNESDSTASRTERFRLERSRTRRCPAEWVEGDITVAEVATASMTSPFTNSNRKAANIRSNFVFRRVFWLFFRKLSKIPSFP